MIPEQTSHLICIGSMVLGIVAIVIVFLVYLVNMGKRTRTFADPATTTVSVPVIMNKALRNYYIKSSYNSCASGQFTNDFVSTAALTNAIKQGCRFLDFEIYDMDGEPVVAVSNSTKYSIKSCYNSLPLSDVFETVKNEAYTASNRGDPLFLNLRIKCTHAEMYKKIGTLLQNFFAERLLGGEYSYEYGGKNLGSVPLSDLLGKVIVVADLSNKKLQFSPFMEYVNLGGNSAFNRMIRYTEVAHDPPSDLAQFVLQNLTMCVPDLLGSASNFDSTVAMNQGIQIVAMCYQSDDTNLAQYNSFFSRYAFVEKSPELQYTPKVVEEAPALPEELNYGNIVTTIRAGDNVENITVA
jgi:hypothetical protein